MTEKKAERLNRHYYKYLHKEKHRNRLNTFLYFVVWKLTYRIFSLSKVDKKLILFAANKDTAIPNDFQSIYNYAKSSGYKTLCLCKPAADSEIFYKNELKKIIYDLRFTKYYAKAKCTFVSDYYLPAFANPPRKGSRLVQVWHGCGAFKKWGYSVKESSWGLDGKQLKKLKVHKTYTDIITSGEEVNKFYAEAFDADISKVKALGVARTDVFFDKGLTDSKKQEIREKFNIGTDKKIILWAPTFRGDNLQKSHNEITLDLEKMYNALKDDYVLLIKLHPHVVKGFNARTFAPDYMKGFAIKPHPSYPIENLLCAADIVISDYSSLIFEYALLERPMIFYAYDLDEYKEGRSFYYDYESFVPGEIVKDTDSLIREIQSAEASFNRDKVIEFRKKFMSACDGNSAKRIFDEIMKTGENYGK